jgi:membrane protein
MNEYHHRSDDTAALEARRSPRGRRQEPDGRGADSPSDIPWSGWKEIGGRVKTRLKRDHVSLLSAGVAFKALLAIFPAIIAAITIWGLVASPEEITEQLAELTEPLPDEAATLLEEQMVAVAGGGTGALSVALIISILVALWSASSGVAGLMEGVNAAYGEVDQRGFPRKRGLALLLTVAAIVFLLITLGLIALLPAALGTIGLDETGTLLARIAVWPLLAILVIGALAVVYGVAPDRTRPQRRWVTWGAVIATVLWLIGSALFTVYVENFGQFGETYGALAGIIVLMLWLYLSAFVVLLGAEINAEMEKQTMVDTTVGDAEPLGRRGAVKADTMPNTEEWATRRRRG